MSQTDNIRKLGNNEENVVENDFKILKEFEYKLNCKVTILGKPNLKKGGIDLATTKELLVDDGSGKDEIDMIDYLLPMATISSMLEQQLTETGDLRKALSSLGITTGELKIVNRFNQKVQGWFIDNKVKQILGNDNRKSDAQKGESE